MLAALGALWADVLFLNISLPRPAREPGWPPAAPPQRLRTSRPTNRPPAGGAGAPRSPLTPPPPAEPPPLPVCFRVRLFVLFCFSAGPRGGLEAGRAPPRAGGFRPVVPPPALPALCPPLPRHPPPVVRPFRWRFGEASRDFPSAPLVPPPVRLPGSAGGGARAARGARAGTDSRGAVPAHAPAALPAEDAPALPRGPAPPSTPRPAGRAGLRLAAAEASPSPSPAFQPRPAARGGVPPCGKGVPAPGAPPTLPAVRRTLSRCHQPGPAGYAGFVRYRLFAVGVCGRPRLYHWSDRGCQFPASKVCQGNSGGK